MGATLQWFNRQLYYTSVNHWTTIAKHSLAVRGEWLFLMRNIPSSFSVWIPPCRRRQLPFWTLNMKAEKKRILGITESLMRWCRLTEETQNTPNAANCGSFFHFPKEAGGLIHVTLVWRSRSPMERSTTYQMNQTPAVHLLRLTPDGKRCVPTSFFSPLCSRMSWSKTAPNSSWIFCISLMWLATLFIAFMATVDKWCNSFNRMRLI